MNNALMARFADNTATLVAPESRTWFESCLTHAHAEFERFTQRMTAEVANDAMQDDFWYAADDWRAQYRPYVVKDGTLQIPVKGVLLNDFPFALGGWATGYEYIWQAFKRGMSDSEVKRIALVCHSPGGEVAGNFDLVDRMFEMRGTKPVAAFAHEYAYSAAYSIASVADKGQLWISRTGGVGSIGVVTSHVDVSVAMEQAGLKITFIYAGKHKVDGNAYEALPDDVKARIQARIDALYAVFVSTVARNKGMDEQAIRATEALTFSAQDALSNKLADKIGTLDDALAAFAADLSSTGEEDMKTPEEKAADQAAIDAARAQGVTEGTQTGMTAGAAAEKTRIVAILASDPAKDRPKAALAAALNSDMTVEQASTFLATLDAEAKTPVAGSTETPGGGTDAFGKAMDNGENPNVGGGAGGNGGEKPSRAQAALARVKGEKAAV